MLVLSRHKNENIVIGDDLTIEEAREQVANAIASMPDVVPEEAVAILLAASVRRVDVAVVDVRGDKVRIGIEAQKHVPVHRKEIYEAIKRNNQNPGQ